EFFDHLDAGAAVLGDLIDVGAFHEAHADVCVSRAISRASVAIAGELKFRARKKEVKRSRFGARGKRIAMSRSGVLACGALTPPGWRRVPAKWPDAPDSSPGYPAPRDRRPAPQGSPQPAKRTTGRGS